MAIAPVNSGSSEKTTAALTFVYTLPWSPTAGNTLLVYVSGNNGSAGTTYSVADSAGGGNYAQDSLHKDGVAGGVAAGCYRRDNIPSGITTVTITCSASTFLSIAVVENSGHLSSGSFDVAPAGAHGTSVSAQAGSYTPTTGDAAYMTMSDGGSGTVTLTTATSGWAVRTKQESTTGMPICVIENLNSSGAQNPTVTLGSSSTWSASGASYKVGTAAAKAPPPFRKTLRVWNRYA